MKKLILTVALMSLAGFCRAGGYDAAEQQMLLEAAKGGNTYEAHSAQMLICMRAREEEVEKDKESVRKYYADLAQGKQDQRNLEKGYMTKNVDNFNSNSNSQSASHNTYSVK